MNRVPWMYALVGLLIGGVTTALAIFLVKLSPQRSFAVSPASETSLAQSQTTQTTQKTAPNNFPGFPRPGGTGAGMMMGQSDQHFMIMMIPHHEGAVAMADLALNRAKHPELKQLAQTIKDTQIQEIQQMHTWYKQWYGTDVPAWEPGMRWGWYNRNQSGNRGKTAPYWGPGMMGMHRTWNGGNQAGNWSMGCCMGGSWMGTDLTALKNASDFDRAFIEEMVPHHQMAVMMSQMVLTSNPQRPEIRQLAESILKSQTNEINQMQQWYRKWYQS